MSRCRLALLAVLTGLSTFTGCVKEAKTREADAIALVQHLGGTFEPQNPSPGHPVFRVSLRDTAVTDEHLRYLDGFPALRLLSLANTQISDAGMENLKRLPRLRQLTLTGSRVTADGMRDLRNALPAVMIRR